MASSTGGKNFPLVPFADWFAKLESIASSASANPDTMRQVPGTKLLSFYREMARKDKAARDANMKHGANREAAGQIDLNTHRMQGASETIRDVPSLTPNDAMRWVDYWKLIEVFE